jgi:hypothetical protein
MTPELVRQAREIGFNDHVRLDGHSIQVQTEVAGVGALVIRTTVMEGGGIRLKESLPCPTDSGDIAAVRAAVHAQHQRVIELVKRGEVS